MYTLSSKKSSGRSSASANRGKRDWPNRTAAWLHYTYPQNARANVIEWLGMNKWKGRIGKWTH